jgi:hypothetical protein
MRLNAPIPGLPDRQTAGPDPPVCPVMPTCQAHANTANIALLSTSRH